MCLIVVCLEKRAQQHEIEEMAFANPHGLGVSWIDREKGLVRWIKGVKIAHAASLAKRLPMPYLIHARLATIGSKADKLCHPFEIAALPSEKLRGSAPKVLAHNGHYEDWGLLLDVAGLPVPEYGDPAWSDSRGIAALLSRADERILQSLDSSRWVILDASNNGPQVRIWGAWNTHEQGRIWSGGLYPAKSAGFSWGTYEGDDLAGWRPARDEAGGAIDRAGGAIDRERIVVADGAYSSDFDDDGGIDPDMPFAFDVPAEDDPADYGPFCNLCASENHVSQRCPWTSVVGKADDDGEAYLDKLAQDATLRHRRQERLRLKAGEDYLDKLAQDATLRLRLKAEAVKATARAQGRTGLANVPLPKAPATKPQGQG